jgi:hypothetical protein
MRNYAALRALGLGVVPIYVGNLLPPQLQRGPITSTQGAIDGQDAAQLATRAGFSPGHRIFLDVDDITEVRQQYVQYFQAWSHAVQNAGFRSGIRALSHVSAPFIQANPQSALWCQSHYVRGAAIFGAQVNVRSGVGSANAQIDINLSMSADPATTM